MLSRRANDGPDDERQSPTTPHRVFLEVAYAADAKHDTLQSAPRLLRDGVATFNTGFCLPVLLTNMMQANFEDVIVHVKAADDGATLAEISMPLGELLASGCTTQVHYIDDHLGVSRFAQVPDDASAMHPTDDTRGHNVPSGVSTSALARQVVMWMKELAAEPASPHVRRQGRLLASIRLWRHSASSTAVPLWSHPLGWAERSAAAAQAPALRPFVLTARVYQITELFLPDDALVCAKLFLGDCELHEFPAVPVRDHTAVLDTFGGRSRRRSRDGRASDGFPLQLEPDCEAVPDLFLNVYQVHGHPHRLERVMFLRLRAKALRMLAGREAPMWWLLDNHRRPTADLSTHAGLMYALFALRTAEEAEAAAPMSAAAPELSRHSLTANSDHDGSNQPASMPPVATARNLSLRCHLLECRDVPSGDATGFSDPFVSVRWGSAYSLGRKLMQQTCDPQFYESITVGPVRLHPGEALPRVSVKVFDWDEAVEVFDPTQLQHTTYLCRALVRLASSRQRAPQWYPMFVANPLVPRGSLLAAFEVIDADTQAPVAIAPDDDPATAVSRPLRRLDDDRHSPAPSQTDLRVGVVGFRNLSFADDPSSFRREPLVMRFYLNFQDGEVFTHAVPVQRVEAFCVGSGEVLDVVDVPCPRDRRSKPSLHVIVEAKTSGRFVASANITVEELAAPRLLPGGRLQYALESLRAPVGGAAGRLEAPSWLDDSGSGGGQGAGGNGGETANAAPSMPQPSREARQVLVWLSWQLMRWWQRVKQSAVAAALIALFNQLLEQFPDVALHFGLEEVEILAPPSTSSAAAASTKQSAAGAGANATSSSSASAVAIRGEASDASDDTPDVATVAFRAAHAGQARDRVPRELEHFLGDCATYHEFPLRRGWKRERGFHSFREMTAATSRASTSPSPDATARASSSRRSPRKSRGSVSRSSAATVKMPVRSRQPRLRRAEEIDAAHLIGELAGRLETPYPVGKLALVVWHRDDDRMTSATPTANVRESSSADIAVPAVHALRSALRQTFRPVSNAVRCWKHLRECGAQWWRTERHDALCARQPLAAAAPLPLDGVSRGVVPGRATDDPGEKLRRARVRDTQRGRGAAAPVAVVARAAVSHAPQPRLAGGLFARRYRPRSADRHHRDRPGSAMVRAQRPHGAAASAGGIAQPVQHRAPEPARAAGDVCGVVVGGGGGGAAVRGAETAAPARVRVAAGGLARHRLSGPVRSGCDVGRQQQTRPCPAVPGAAGQRRRHRDAHRHRAQLRRRHGQLQLPSGVAADSAAGSGAGAALAAARVGCAAALGTDPVPVAATAETTFGGHGHAGYHAARRGGVGDQAAGAQTEPVDHHAAHGGRREGGATACGHIAGAAQPRSRPSICRQRRERQQQLTAAAAPGAPMGGNRLRLSIPGDRIRHTAGGRVSVVGVSAGRPDRSDRFRASATGGPDAGGGGARINLDRIDKNA
eukprot:ctg_561.g211